MVGWKLRGTWQRVSAETMCAGVQGESEGSGRRDGGSWLLRPWRVSRRREGPGVGKVADQRGMGVEMVSRAVCYRVDATKMRLSCWAAGYSRARKKEARERRSRQNWGGVRWDKVVTEEASPCKGLAIVDRFPTAQQIALCSGGSHPRDTHLTRTRRQRWAVGYASVFEGKNILNDHSGINNYIQFHENLKKLPNFQSSSDKGGWNVCCASHRLYTVWLCGAGWDGGQLNKCLYQC